MAPLHMMLLHFTTQDSPEWLLSSKWEALVCSSKPPFLDRFLKDPHPAYRFLVLSCKGTKQYTPFDCAASLRKTQATCNQIAHWAASHVFYLRVSVLFLNLLGNQVDHCVPYILEFWGSLGSGDSAHLVQVTVPVLLRV